MTAAHILVVDDSMVVRAVVRAALECEGYVVMDSADGADALKRCRADPPDVVLLDVEMAGLDGREVLARLKKDERLRDIPVVFLTARTQTEDVIAGLRAGAHDYLKKPFEPAELLARVGSAVQVKKLQDELRRRNAELEKASSTDALTGLRNRLNVERDLAAACAAARRHHEPLGVVLFDLDHFKRVNDTYGHAVGDQALCEFARRLRGQLRAEDIACRWGGEEFLVVLPRTGIAGAAEFAERVRKAVAATPVVANGRRIALTVSGGCGLGPGDPEEIISTADVRLYKAKNAGRNQIVST